eukprot:5337536-Prymnesium_polylepis.1
MACGSSAGEEPHVSDPVRCVVLRLRLRRGMFSYELRVNLARYARVGHVGGWEPRELWVRAPCRIGGLLSPTRLWE